MYKTLRITFSLKNTYRVNSILYSLKQIPLLKRLLPDALYGIQGFKIFANILAIIWEILSIFLGKFLYFLTLVCGIEALYEKAPASQAFLHILLFLTVIGSFANTFLFNPSRDKYYAIILMRMDARRNTLVNYGYAMGKVLLGFLPFTLLFGLTRGIPLWLCLLLPCSIAGMKLVSVTYTLWDYQKRGNVYNENEGTKTYWIAMTILLILAYGSPALGIALPLWVSAAVFLACIPLGLLCIRRIFTFPDYPSVTRQLLYKMQNQMDQAVQSSKTVNQQFITTDTSITSRRKGFEYLNELFIKRHRKILWKATIRIIYGCLVLFAMLLLAIYVFPQSREVINYMILSCLPLFLFALYAINRGTNFTRALFMNCDRSLLTYGFFKQPKAILKLFQIRLREIVKINLVPAGILAAGLSILLFLSGGTEDPWNYAVVLVSIPCISVFFSVHHLILYYLLQPYNAGTEMKSGAFQIVQSLTYFACVLLMQLQVPTLLFGALSIVFCVLYSVIACVLVYHLAPKTFKLRP